MVHHSQKKANVLSHLVGGVWAKACVNIAFHSVCLGHVTVHTNTFLLRLHPLQVSRDTVTWEGEEEEETLLLL